MEFANKRIDNDSPRLFGIYSLFADFMKFKYSARTEKGELQTGLVEAVGKDAALNILKDHNLFVLSLQDAERPRWYDKIFRFLNRVGIRDLMFFSRQFAILLEAKVPISNSLSVLERQNRNPLLRDAIVEVAEGIAAGLSLSQALERRADIFSDFYVSMIRPAELTGRLEQAMGFLADYFEKEAVWIAKIRNALIYPLIVIVLFFAVSLTMVVGVFPQLKPVFEEANVSLPIITRFFINSGEFIIRWWLAIIIVLALFVILIIDYVLSPEGKAVMDELKLRMPIFGEIFKKIYVARFAEAVSILIKGGIPLTQAIEISGHSLGNAVYAEVLHEISEGIKRGELFSVLLSANDRYFPPMVSEMAAIGEGAGKISDVLSKIASIYIREVEDVLNSLVELIQPILIVLIGIFVGLLFASILIPIYDLAKAF